MTALIRLRFAPPPGLAGRVGPIERARGIPDLEKTK
jgi:hypothetical protein